MNTQYQMIVPMTPVVKRLIIGTVAVWLVLVLIVQQFFLSQPYIFEWFGLIPASVIMDFWGWQPLTYMFLHSTNVFHVLFNMLMLWWIGAELEQRWGSRFFFLYYMLTGIGAAFLYLMGVVIYYLVTKDFTPLQAPVVGASGCIFGLMLAYGYLFGERVIYFMMAFPMRAKYFVMILAGVEIVSLLASGLGSDVANLAHLGGLVSGFLILWFWNKFQRFKLNRQNKKRGRKLTLVVDNERQENSGPRYWN